MGGGDSSVCLRFLASFWSGFPDASHRDEGVSSLDADGGNHCDHMLLLVSGGAGQSLVPGCNAGDMHSQLGKCYIRYIISLWLKLS